MEINLPEVIAEIRTEFERYEKALAERDLDVLRDCFHNSTDVVRFGVDDAQRGAAQLAHWRATQPPLPAGRKLSDTFITTFGRTSAVVSTFFSYPDRPITGRQSQTWMKLPIGWRIVHAHVSEVSDQSAGSHFGPDRASVNVDTE